MAKGPARALVSNDNEQVDDVQPFADAAVAMAHQGLAVIPVGGPDGKVPQIQ